MFFFSGWGGRGEEPIVNMEVENSLEVFMALLCRQTRRDH